MRNYFWFQVNLSFKCNLRCPYCYVGEDRNDQTVMSLFHMQKLIEYAKYLVDEYGAEELRVNFLGGEPLLTLEQMLYMASELAKICKTSCRVFTNGTLITDDVMKTLSDAGIFVELSINRTIREEFYELCKKVQPYQKFVRIAFVLDSYNAPRSSIITDFFLRKGYVIKYALENRSFSNQDYLAILRKNLRKCLVWHDLYVSNPRHWHTLFDKIDPMVDPELGYVYGRNMLCFDPDGRVRVMNSVKGAYLGRLGDRQDYIQRMRTINNVAPGVLPRWSKKGIYQCELCEIGDVCQGGYPAPKWYAYGRFDRPSPYCSLFKEIVPELIELYTKKREKCSYDLDDLSLD